MSQNTNQDNYKNALKPFCEEIKSFFNYESCDFNSQGGIGLELNKGDDTIFVWLEDSNNPDEDLLPEDFDNKNDTYTLRIQTEFNSNEQEEINTFDNVNDLIKYLIENNNILSIEESKKLVEEHQSTTKNKIDLGV